MEYFCVGNEDSKQRGVATNQEVERKLSQVQRTTTLKRPSQPHRPPQRLLLRYPIFQLIFQAHQLTEQLVCKQTKRRQRRSSEMCSLSWFAIKTPTKTSRRRRTQSQVSNTPLTIWEVEFTVQPRLSRVWMWVLCRRTAHWDAFTDSRNLTNLVLLLPRRTKRSDAKSETNTNEQCTNYFANRWNILITRFNIVLLIYYATTWL